MNFRLSVTHLRVALLLSNLGLAGGLVGMAGRGMMEASSSVSTVEVFEPSHFEFSEVEGFDARSKRTQIQPVAEWIEPTKRVAPPPGATDETGEEPEAITTGEGGPDYGGPGPLAEEWEYEFYYIFPDAPTESFIRLRRKGTEPQPQAANPRSRIIRGQRRLTRAAIRRGGAGNAENELVFFVKERRIVDKDKDIEFLVDEATPDYVAYRMPNDRNTIYRLPHSDESAMADYETKQTITILGNKDEETKEEGEEEEKVSKIQIVPEGYLDAREREYQEWVSGKITLDKAPNLREETVEPAIPEEEPSDTTSGASVERFQGGTRRPISKEEGLRRMRSAIQDARSKGDMSAEEEKLLKDAMTGKLKAPNKK